MPLYEHSANPIFALQKAIYSVKLGILHTKWTKKRRTQIGMFDLGSYWRKWRDSNPRGLAPKRFSRPPRCDRFDTLPYIKLFWVAFCVAMSWTTCGPDRWRDQKNNSRYISERAVEVAEGRRNAPCASPNFCEIHFRAFPQNCMLAKPQLTNSSFA